jgi:hypothetical protein
LATVVFQQPVVKHCDIIQQPFLGVVFSGEV